MWLRFIAFSFLKWLANLFIISLMFIYLLPATWSGFQLSAPAWIVSFFIAFAFAELAFGKHLPGKRETIKLLLVWMVVSFLMQLLYSAYFFGTITPVIYSLDTYIQYALEILAILLAAYVTRRRTIRWEMAEGLEG